MVQKRYFSGNTPASSRTFQGAVAALTSKTVLSGGELNVITPDIVTINPIALVFESGVILEESEIKSLQVLTTSLAKNYTLTYRYNDSNTILSSSATLALEDGFITNDNILNGLAIGYVVYPGGAVPLTQAMLIEAPKQTINGFVSAGDIDYRLPPFGEGFMHATATPEASFSNDGSVTDGSTTFTSIGYTFTTSDVGKGIKINNSIPNGGIARIIAFINSSQVTVNRTWSATESSLTWDLLPPTTTIVTTSDTATSASLVYSAGLGGNTYTAQVAGPGGNDITIEYVTNGPSLPLVVSVVSNAITVQLATNGSNVITSTVASITSAINGFGPSSALVQAVTNGVGTTVATLLAETNLSGGSSGFGFVYNLYNPTGSSETDVLKWVFVVGSIPPKSFRIEYAQGVGSSVTVSITDTNGTLLTFPSGTVTSSTDDNGITTKVYRITDGIFEPGKRYNVQISILTAAGTNSAIASVGASIYNLPF